MPRKPSKRTQLAESPGPRLVRVGSRWLFVAADRTKWFVRRDRGAIVFGWGGSELRAHLEESEPPPKRRDLGKLLERARAFSVRPVSADAGLAERPSLSVMSDAELEGLSIHAPSVLLREGAREELGRRLRSRAVEHARCPNCETELALYLARYGVTPAANAGRAPS